MSYTKLARAIKRGYNELKKDTLYKLYYITQESQEITVENDAGFKAIIIGNTSGGAASRGYMYLFYSNDDDVRFPTIKEIERRLRIVAKQEELVDEDVSYFDWEEYGSLKKQREYFSEIIKDASFGKIPINI